MYNTKKMKDGVLMETFNNYLKKYRENLSLTKRQMAVKFSWTPMYYGRYENGDIIPSDKVLRKFSDILNIDYDFLKTLVDNQKK